jgi:ribosomal protein S18 acetylase RimI-like enzyme
VVFFELLVWFYLNLPMISPKPIVPVRIASADDAARITAVINAAFRIAEGFFIDGNRIKQSEVEQLVAKGTFLLAGDVDKLNGCVYVELRGERSYLGLLSVDPSCQQGGLGSRLMLEAEEYCRARGSRFMDILIVNLREDLPAFYSKRGYVQNGTSPFPEDVETRILCHFINMSKSL